MSNRPSVRNPGSWSFLLAVAATVILFEPSHAQNLVTNPGFESGTTGWYGPVGLTTSGTLVHSGSACGLAPLAPFGSMGQSMLGKLQAGHTYNESAWLRASSGTPSVTMGLNQMDSNGSSAISLATRTIGATWTLCSTSFTLNVAGTLSDVNITFTAGSLAVSLYLDDVSLTDASPTGVPGQTVAGLALEPPWPNPARAGHVDVSFSLPTPEAARIEIIDLSGRRVAEREVGLLGPGRHAVSLAGERPLPAGLYFVRLAQGATALTVRVAILD
jgi:hypothetical protein